MTKTLEGPPSDSFDPSTLPPEMREHLEKMATPLHLMVAVSAGSSQPLSAPKHLRYINERITTAVTDRSQQSFIILELPVRHAKSFYCSWALPVWFLGMNPDDQVILVTYSDDFSKRWGRDARDLMKLWGPELFGQTVNTHVASAEEWSLKGHRGGMRSVGVGGVITGLGGDLIIVDDPLKNIQEAMSDKVREMQVNWLDSTLRTRLMPGGTLIILMARWHEGDIVGVIKERLEAEDYAGDPYEIIHLPAIATAPEGEDSETWRDELGRADGEELWPEVWPIDTLRQIEASVDTMTWGALYQQDPALEKSSWFPEEMWRWVDYMSPAEMDAIRSVRWWDLAASEGEGDWTVGARVGIDHDNNIWIMSVERFRKHPAAVEDRVVSTAQTDGLYVPIRMEQERAGAGKTNTANYARLLLGYDFDGIPAETKVEIRARAYAAAQKKGLVIVNRAGVRERDFLKEHKGFPRTRYDDQVDAISNAFNWLMGGGETSMLDAADLTSTPVGGARVGFPTAEEPSIYETPLELVGGAEAPTRRPFK